MSQTIIRGLTLWQPWAGLVANQFKNFETRSWSTTYRGILLIHSAKRPPYQSELEPFIKDIPSLKELAQDLGKIVAIAKLTDCILMTDEFIQKQSKLERLCGNWQPGRYAWKLGNIRKIDPIPCQGKQNLWTPSRDVTAQLILKDLI